MVHVPKIKICGLTQLENLRTISHLGIDAVGFVFYPPSKRYVSVEDAACLVRDVPAFVASVGLFVNPTDAEFDAVLANLPLTLLQFHGDESPQRCAELATRARLPWIKALRVNATTNISAFVNLYANATGWLLDADAVGYGGSGHVFDWSLIPLDVRQRIILSGGLNPNNVHEAIKQISPWAVDVSTGVEVSPGIKSAELVKRFVAHVREAL